MIEERVIGGTCVNRGCLSSKNLIGAAQLAHDAAHPRYPGLGSASIDIDFASLVRQKDQIVAGYRQKKYESLVGGKFRIEQGHAEFVDNHRVEVNGKRLIGDAILIATGSRPGLPDIRGLSEVPFLTSDLLAMGEESELTDLPSSMLIIGGGYVALELAQMFHRLGTAVIIVERGRDLVGLGYEPEVGPAVRELLVQEGIEVLTHATVSDLRADSGEIAASIVVNGAPRELRAQRLLIATGRLPNTERIGLEKTAVTIGGHRQVIVDEYLRTSVPHIFAAGDVIGREQGNQMATPVGSQDGGTVAYNAFSGGAPRKANHRVVPRAVFIDPPLASVGMTEQEATAAGRHCWCGIVPMSLVPKAEAIRDTRGFVKMVADDETGEVLGVTMLGHSASEVIHVAAMALRFRAMLQDFIDLLHVYPTMAEALKLAAVSRFKNPATLSCCAQ